MKLSVRLYFMSGAGKGDMKAVAVARRIGHSIVLSYLENCARDDLKF